MRLCEFRQHRGIDLIFAERRLVSLQPQIAKPPRISLLESHPGKLQMGNTCDHVYQSQTRRPPMLAFPYGAAKGSFGASLWKNAFAENGEPTSAVRFRQGLQLIPALRPGSPAAAVRHQ